MDEMELIKELERRFDNRGEGIPTDVSKRGTTFLIETKDGWEEVTRQAVSDTIGDEKATVIWHWAHK